jgi:hypothetical protein
MEELFGRARIAVGVERVSFGEERQRVILAGMERWRFNGKHANYDEQDGKRAHVLIILANPRRGFKRDRSPVVFWRIERYCFRMLSDAFRSRALSPDACWSRGGGR